MRAPLKLSTNMIGNKIGIFVEIRNGEKKYHFWQSGHFHHFRVHSQERGNKISFQNAFDSDTTELM